MCAAGMGNPGQGSRRVPFAQVQSMFHKQMQVLKSFSEFVVSGMNSHVASPSRTVLRAPSLPSSDIRRES